MKTDCTLASPRTLTWAIHPIVFAQPKISSMRLRTTGMPGDTTIDCGLVGFAHFGDVTVDRDVGHHSTFAQRLDELGHVVGLVGADGGAKRPRCQLYPQYRKCAARAPQQTTCAVPFPGSPSRVWIAM